MTRKKTTANTAPIETFEQLIKIGARRRFGLKSPSTQSLKPLYTIT